MLKKDKNCIPKKLLHKYKIDIWGTYILKHKFNILTKKILLNFESNLRLHSISKLRKLFISQKFKPWYKKKRFNKKPKYNINKKKFSNNSITVNKQTISKPLIESKFIKKKNLKKIFFKHLFKYFNFYRKRFNIIPKLELLWLKAHINRLRFKLPWILRTIKTRHIVKKYLRRRYIKFPTYNLYSKLDLLKSQHFFCFSTLSQIRRYLKRVEYSRRPDPIFLGLEGCFLNIIFRTNLFLTTKQAYSFIKLGAFSVNGITLTNPYKILTVFDVFSVNPAYIKVIWTIFIKKIRKKLILVNIPNYIDFDYKFLRFFIWRLPTRLEKNFVYYFPFHRSSNLGNIEVYPIKNQFISPIDYKLKPSLR